MIFWLLISTTLQYLLSFRDFTVVTRILSYLCIKNNFINVSTAFSEGIQGINDIVFAFDTSDDVTENDLDNMKSLSKSLLESFKVQPSKMRVAIVTFGGDVQSLSTLADSTSVGKLHDVLANMKREGGDSRIGPLLRNADVDIFSTSKGGRLNSGKVLIIITKTSSVSGIGNHLSYLSSQLQEQSIKTIVVGVDFTQDQLNVITGNPGDVVPVNGINSLRTVFPSVEKKISESLSKYEYSSAIHLIRTFVIRKKALKLHKFVTSFFASNSLKKTP